MFRFSSFSRPAARPFHLGSLLLLAPLAACAPAGGVQTTDEAVSAEGAASTVAAPADAEVTAFVGVNVIPMDRERVLPNQTVLVRDGRIAEIGAAGEIQVPAEATRIEAGGKYLLPGLAEMHAHVLPPQAAQQFGEAFNEDILFLYLANGITTVRGMLGHPAHLELRERAERGELLSPRIYTSGPSFNGNSVESPEAAKRMVIEQKEAGYDFLKLHPGLTREEFDTINAVADRVGIRFAGHVSEDVGLRRALEAGQASVDHLDGYVDALVPEPVEPGSAGFFGINLLGRVDESKIPELAAQTREAGVWNVPTQSLIEHLAGPDDPDAMARRPEMQYVPPQMVAQWVEAKQNLQGDPSFDAEVGRRFIELRRQIIRALRDADAGLLLGSDAPQVFNVPGFAAHHELRMLVDAGLTPYEALETGTRNPAVYFGELDDWGTIEEGKTADLLLLDANPLEDITNSTRIAGVMRAGRWVPADEIRTHLEGIQKE